MRSAVLRGREHTDVGAISTVAEGTVAIGLSRGGAPKTYAHTDPNEDAAAFAAGQEGALLAVADGHSGFEAAEVVIEHLVSHPAPQWTGEDDLDSEAFRRQAVAALSDANAEILRERVQGMNLLSETTLAAAVIRPGQRQLSYLCMGDSHLFVAARDGTVQELGLWGRRPTPFLGQTDETLERLEETTRIGCQPLDDLRVVVCVTDGLSEPGVGVANPPATIAELVLVLANESPELRPLRLAREICERACQAHRKGRSGDNVAVAVAWL